MPQDRHGGAAATVPGAAAPERATSTERAAGAGVEAPAGGLDARTERDHKAISDLADELLPALIARLAASGLGEIEVREGTWKARLRKPAGADDRKAAGRSSVDGHSAHGHAPTRGSAASLGHAAAEDRERLAREEQEARELANLPIVAVSPAVGIYQPRKDLAAGMQVRAGDRLGTVDVLGVREDVVAPVDGAIGSSLAEAGEAVEYGQELIRIELPENSRRLEVNGADREAAAVLGEA
jgi:biotin carboxyl carrier protein